MKISISWSLVCIQLRCFNTYCVRSGIPWTWLWCSCPAPPVCNCRKSSAGRNSDTTATWWYFGDGWPRKFHRSSRAKRRGIRHPVSPRSNGTSLSCDCWSNWMLAACLCRTPSRDPSTFRIIRLFLSPSRISVPEEIFSRWNIFIILYYETSHVVVDAIYGRLYSCYKCKFVKENGRKVCSIGE